MTQPDDHITVSEGARLELKCNYSSSVSPYLFWDVQFLDQELQLLLKYVSGDNLVSGIKGFEAEFRKSEKSFHLRKIPAHWKDSAKYFCALSDTVPGTAGGAGHKPPGHCSSVFDIFRKLACSVRANSTDNTESWKCLVPTVILDFSFLHFFLSFLFFFLYHFAKERLLFSEIRHFCPLESEF